LYPLRDAAAFVAQNATRRAGAGMTREPAGVLMVTGAYFPEVSGAGLQCRELVRQLRDAVRITVLTTTTDPTLPAAEERDGSPIHRVFVDPASVRSKIAAALRVIRIFLVERRRFSILHLHGFSQKSVLLVALGLLTGKRIAIKLTSVGHDDPQSMKARGALTYWCYSRARMFFGVSPRLQALYAASGLPPDRFRLIANGVDVTRFRPAAAAERRALRAELNLPIDGVVVLFVGFFSREKCPDLLFDAWSRVAAEASDSSVLVLVGATRSTYYEIDRSLADRIRARAAGQRLDRRLHFVESTLEIEKYHRAADIFVLPSLREGLPNALMEAMACGAGCIATRLEAVTDVLIADGESGFLVAPRDVDALETSLRRLISQPACARAMGMRARTRIERDFSLTKTAEQYLAAYRELLAS
jgi:glycosyltransferase involved in cell wall biosynthesis